MEYISCIEQVHSDNVNVTRQQQWQHQRQQQRGAVVPRCAAVVSSQQALRRCRFGPCPSLKLCGLINAASLGGFSAGVALVSWWHGSARRKAFVCQLRCSKIAEAEAAVSVNEKNWLEMHMHVQLKLDELSITLPLASLDVPNLG